MRRGPSSIALPACAAVIAAAALTAAERAPLSAAPSLRDVMARIGTYAAAYGDSLASVVADEDYLQQLTFRSDGAPLQERRLESEIAFVRLGSATEWLAFRSVLRVDGAAVSDGAGQLERVFRDAPGSALGRARAITAESARHNIGPVQRNFNVPTTVLHFILPENQDRFRFSKKREERHAAETVWIVEFREHGRSSFIRTPEGRRAPAEGLLWVAPEDGRVVRSRLVVKADVEAEIEVAWQRDARLALWVPVEMREVYRAPGLKTTGGTAKPEAYDVRGLARYTNYRRFEVDTRIVR